MRKIGEKPQGPQRKSRCGALGYKIGPTLRNEGWGTRKGEKQIPRRAAN
jgi:hypothetical protein